MGRRQHDVCTLASHQGLIDRQEVARQVPRPGDAPPPLDRLNTRWRPASALRQTGSVRRICGRELTVLSLDGWSVTEWLTMNGWKVEMSGDRGDVRGAATREVSGDTVRVEGRGTTCEELAWSLIEQAATELERRQDPQNGAVAA